MNDYYDDMYSYRGSSTFSTFEDIPFTERRASSMKPTYQSTPPRSRSGYSGFGSIGNVVNRMNRNVATSNIEDYYVGGDEVLDYAAPRQISQKGGHGGECNCGQKLRHEINELKHQQQLFIMFLVFMTVIVLILRNKESPIIDLIKPAASSDAK